MSSLPKYDNSESIESNNHNDILKQNARLRSILRGETPALGICNTALGIVNNWDKFSEAQRKNYSIAVAESADMVINLIDNILGYARLDSTKPDLTLENLNMTDLVADIVKEQATILAAKSKTDIFTVDFDDNLFIKCDKYYIKQLVINLITNTVKYAELGKILISLKKASMSTKDLRRTTAPKVVDVVKFTIEYKQTSQMRKEIIRLLDIFSTASKAFEALDLSEIALALSKKVAEVHKGKLWAEETREKVKFCFALPI